MCEGETGYAKRKVLTLSNSMVRLAIFLTLGHAASAAGGESQSLVSSILNNVAINDLLSSDWARIFQKSRLPRGREGEGQNDGRASVSGQGSKRGGVSEPLGTARSYGRPSSQTVHLSATTNAGPSHFGGPQSAAGNFAASQLRDISGLSPTSASGSGSGSGSGSTSASEQGLAINGGCPQNYLRVGGQCVARPGMGGSNYVRATVDCPAGCTPSSSSSTTQLSCDCIEREPLTFACEPGYSEVPANQQNSGISGNGQKSLPVCSRLESIEASHVCADPSASLLPDVLKCATESVANAFPSCASDSTLLNELCVKQHTMSPRLVCPESFTLVNAERHASDATGFAARTGSGGNGASGALGGSGLRRSKATNAGNYQPTSGATYTSGTFGALLQHTGIFGPSADMGRGANVGSGGTQGAYCESQNSSRATKVCAPPFHMSRNAEGVEHCVTERLEPAILRCPENFEPDYRQNLCRSLSRSEPINQCTEGFLLTADPRRMSAGMTTKRTSGGGSGSDSESAYDNSALAKSGRPRWIRSMEGAGIEGGDDDGEPLAGENLLFDARETESREEAEGAAQAARVAAVRAVEAFEGGRPLRSLKRTLKFSQPTASYRPHTFDTHAYDSTTSAFGSPLTISPAPEVIATAAEDPPSRYLDKDSSDALEDNFMPAEAAPLRSARKDGNRQYKVDALVSVVVDADDFPNESPEASLTPDNASDYAPDYVTDSRDSGDSSGSLRAGIRDLGYASDSPMGKHDFSPPTVQNSWSDTSPITSAREELCERKVYEPVVAECRDGFEFSQREGLCVRVLREEAAFVCRSHGFVFDGKNCVHVERENPQKVCPAGQVLRSQPQPPTRLLSGGAAYACVSAELVPGEPACKDEGAVYDRSLDRCVTSEASEPSLECPPGMELSEEDLRCHDTVRLSASYGCLEPGYKIQDDICVREEADVPFLKCFNPNAVLRAGKCYTQSFTDSVHICPQGFSKVLLNASGEVQTPSADPYPLSGPLPTCVRDDRVAAMAQCRNGFARLGDESCIRQYSLPGYYHCTPPTFNDPNDNSRCLLSL